jgi:hypothetical protein
MNIDKVQVRSDAVVLFTSRRATGPPYADTAHACSKRERPPYGTCVFEVALCCLSPGSLRAEVPS